MNGLPFKVFHLALVVVEWDPVGVGANDISLAPANSISQLPNKRP